MRISCALSGVTADSEAQEISIQSLCHRLRNQNTLASEEKKRYRHRKEINNMLEQPVKIRDDGTIDDRYEFDTVDEIMYEADKVLMAPCEAGGKLLEARERYLYMENRAQGIAGFDYARMGAYGCKITGTGCTEHDAFTDFAEAGERLQEAEQRYKEEQEKCIALLEECDRLQKNSGEL